MFDIQYKRKTHQHDYPVQHSNNLGKIHDADLCRKTSRQNWSKATGNLSLNTAQSTHRPEPGCFKKKQPAAFAA
jgi:hypothetical protein